jgi:hypothetical protein
VAGETHTEVLDPGAPADSLFQVRPARLQQLISAGGSDDAITSERLFLVGLRYMQEADQGVDFSSGMRWQRAVKRAFEADVARRVNVT